MFFQMSSKIYQSLLNFFLLELRLSTLLDLLALIDQEMVIFVPFTGPTDDQSDGSALDIIKSMDDIALEEVSLGLLYMIT